MIIIDDIEIECIDSGMSVAIIRDGDGVELKCPIRNGYLLEPEDVPFPECRDWLRQLDRAYRRFFELATRACAAYIIDEYLYFYHPLPEAAHRFILELIGKYISSGLTENQIAERFFLSPEQCAQLKSSADGFDTTLVNNICDSDGRLSYRDFPLSPYTPPKGLPEPAALLTMDAARLYLYDGEDEKRAREAVEAHTADLPMIARAADQLLEFMRGHPHHGNSERRLEG